MARFFAITAGWNAIAQTTGKAPEAHRETCGRKCDAIAKGAFLDYVRRDFGHHWSLDARFGRALVTGEFQRGEMVCTKTLYNYVTLEALEKIKSIDLPCASKRKTPGSGS